MITKRKSISIGMNGIEVLDGYEKCLVPWSEIVGINGSKDRSEIYTNKGKAIKFKYILFNILDYKIFDYEKNQIRVGNPIEIKDWQTAFTRIKNYIKERGGNYVEELEGVYNSWWSLMQFGNLGNMKFPIEEIKEKKIIKVGIAMVFLYWFLLFIWGVIFGNEINNELLGFSIAIVGILLWVFFMFMVLYARRTSKIIKILKRNNIIDGEDDEKN